VHPTLLSLANADPSCKARLYLAATLTPYKYITYLDKKTNKKEKPQAVVDYIIRESLKLGTQNHYLDGTPLLFEADQLLEGPTFINEKDQTHSERVAIGLHFEYP
jgi:tRNA nucleotidyltransferase (CCA-adding enzyme)